MTATTMPDSEVTESYRAEEALEYRSVSIFAVLGLLLGILSAVSLFTAGTSLDWTISLSPIPLAGLVVSLIALRSIASAPDLYTGKSLAQTGAVLSAFFLLTAVGYSTYVYTTEVPDGYERTSFIAMKPTDQNIVNRELIPPEIEAFIASQAPVFIKGYIRPDSIKFKQNLNNFLLVRDNQQCCFGDLSKVQFFDQIKVNLGPGLTTDYNSGLFRLGGVLRIEPGDPSIGTPITYAMDADYVNP